VQILDLKINGDEGVEIEFK